MNSCLLECRLVHHRRWPREHRFVNRLFFLSLDLDEAPSLLQRLWLLSPRRLSLYSHRDADYLRPDPATSAENAGSSAPLKERVRALFARHGVALRPDVRVLLVTVPRIAGYHFNPVSFYFCSHGDEPVGAIAEVTNTFRETKTYVLGPDTLLADGTFQLRAPKHFYVSPFSEAGDDFDFTLLHTGDGLSVRIDEHHAGRLILHSAVHGTRRELGDGALAWFAVKYPLLSLQIITRIHTQALRLFLTRLPWWRKTDQPALQRDFVPPPRAPHPVRSGLLPSSRS